MSTVVVTGASGFVGSRVVPILAGNGYEVHGVSRKSPARGQGAAAWHELDLLDPEALPKLFDDIQPTHLLHLAWCTEHGRFWESPENDDWAEASIRLWRAFRDAGGTRFVGVGSCAEYEWGEVPLVEDSSPVRPASRYGSRKDKVRRTLQAEAGEVGSWAWGRLFFLYGPQESSERLVSFVAESLLAGRVVPTTDGEQVRDYLHVDDAARALADLVGSNRSGAYNIGSGDGHRVRDIIEAIGRICDAPELIEFGAIDRPADDAEAVVADIAKARDLGWSPRVELTEGLRSTVSALRGNGHRVGEAVG